MKQLFAKRNLLDRLIGEEEINADISEKTIRQYRQKLRTLANKTSKHLAAENQQPMDPTRVSLGDMADYLAHMSQDTAYSSSYISKFRSALLYHIYEKAKTILDNGGQIDEHSRIYDSVRSVLIKDKPQSKSGRTNSQAPKFFDRNFYDYCIKILSRKKRVSKVEMALQDYLQANLHLGLRPHEWMNARPSVLLGESPQNMLVIDNSKNSNERANGEYRELLLDKLPPNTLESASRLILHFQQHADQYQMKYGYDRKTAEQRAALSINKNLNRMLHKLERSYIQLRPNQKTAVSGTTLYSLRHQAIANAKADNLDDIEVSAIFGHVSIRTAKEYYGKKSNGWGTRFMTTTTMHSMMPVIERIERHRKPTQKYIPTINPGIDANFWSS